MIGTFLIHTDDHPLIGMERNTKNVSKGNCDIEVEKTKRTKIIASSITGTVVIVMVFIYLIVYVSLIY